MPNNQVMVEKVALKPCPNPWCNAVDKPLVVFLKREGWRVICDCSVHTPRFPEQAEAITAWNSRQPSGWEAERELLRQAMNVLGAAADNDPNETVADNGMTVWDCLKSESERLWAKYRALPPPPTEEQE